MLSLCFHADVCYCTRQSLDPFRWCCTSLHSLPTVCCRWMHLADMWLWAVCGVTSMLWSGVSVPVVNSWELIHAWLVRRSTHTRVLHRPRVRSYLMRHVNALYTMLRCAPLWFRAAFPSLADDEASWLCLSTSLCFISDGSGQSGCLLAHAGKVFSVTWAQATSAHTDGRRDLFTIGPDGCMVSGLCYVSITSQRKHFSIQEDWDELFVCNSRPCIVWCLHEDVWSHHVLNKSSCILW